MKYIFKLYKVPSSIATENKLSKFGEWNLNPPREPGRNYEIWYNYHEPGSREYFLFYIKQKFIIENFYSFSPLSRTIDLL